MQDLCHGARVGGIEEEILPHWYRMFCFRNRRMRIRPIWVMDVSEKTTLYFGQIPLPSEYKHSPLPLSRTSICIALGKMARD